MVRCSGKFLLLSTLFLICSCGLSQADAEKLTERMIQAFNDTSGTLSTIKDEKSLEAAKEQLQERIAKIKAIKLETQKAKITQATEKALQTKYAESLAKASSSLQTEITRVKRIPGSEEIVRSILEAFAEEGSNPSKK